MSFSLKLSIHLLVSSSKKTVLVALQYSLPCPVLKINFFPFTTIVILGSKHCINSFDHLLVPCKRNNLINTNILNKKKYDELPLMCYNFADEKNNLINYLKYKKQKLYNKLSRRDYDDYREVLQDIYYFYEFNLKDINNINFDDPFIFKFNEIKSNIKYDYKAIKIQL